MWGKNLDFISGLRGTCRVTGVRPSKHPDLKRIQLDRSEGGGSSNVIRNFRDV